MPTPPICTSLISISLDPRTAVPILCIREPPASIVPYHSTLTYLGYRHWILLLSYDLICDGNLIISLFYGPENSNCWRCGGCGSRGLQKAGILWTWKEGEGWSGAGDNGDRNQGIWGVPASRLDD